MCMVQGQESDRRVRYIEEFERKIKLMPTLDADNKLCKDMVTVEHHLDDGKVSYAADFKNNEINEQKYVPWILNISSR